ncbi:hypothetical protein F4804DRAFT_338113 [Jackrogersella minutella]|nr:hypothetical protein F4804DRAFT_338113 [Jackrogersella minutella]
MAAAKTDHLERTAAEPRDKSLHTVTLAEVTEINDQIRLFRLELAEPLRFLPGQWLDVYVPGVAKAGGYTITSPPSRARAVASTPEGPSSPGYVELAVQKSPDPPAAWLWRDPDAIVYAELRVRACGSFVWPPLGVDVHALRRLVFVAGGVGVNPLASMLGTLAEEEGDWPFEVRFLYSLKNDRVQGGDTQVGRLLFVRMIAEVFAAGRVKGKLQLFLTGGEEEEEGEEGVLSWEGEGGEMPFRRRRITTDDVAAAIGDASERRSAVVYVCGVPTMTDEFVQKLVDPQQGLGMKPHRVLCERWW